MAKKKSNYRRAPRSTTPRTFGDGQPSAAVAQTAEAVRPNGTPAVAAKQPSALVRRTSAGSRLSESRSQVPLPVEYHYVLPDLRRLGLLALSTFGIMIVLGILIR